MAMGGRLVTTLSTSPSPFSPDRRSQTPPPRAKPPRRSRTCPPPNRLICHPSPITFGLRKQQPNEAQKESAMQKITPNLWFDDQAEEAARFYTAVFKNSRINTIARYGSAGPLPAGTVMTVDFELDGQHFTALNGGPADFTFNEALSLIVNCASQDEVDYYWQRLSEDGEEGAC